jgi:hypothetical protein
MESINLVDLMVYGLQFIKEKFLVIYGEIKHLIIPGKLTPYTLIKYYRSD